MRTRTNHASTPHEGSSRQARRRHRAGIQVVVVLGTLAALLLVPGTANAAVTCTFSPVERHFVKLTNNARKSRGLAPLRLDHALSNVSHLHSKEMRSRTRLYHTSNRTLGWRVSNWTTVGENIGYLNNARGTGAQRQARTIFRMFMNSPTHRANILRRGSYRYQGVGVVYQGRRMWITHTFSGSRKPGTRVRRNHCR